MGNPIKIMDLYIDLINLDIYLTPSWPIFFLVLFFSSTLLPGGSDDVSQGIQLELLETLRGLMNNEMGMENVRHF